MVNALLKAPKESKLPKDEAIQQQKQIVDGQNQDIVYHAGPKRNLALEELLQNRFTNGYHGIPRAGKYQQDYKYLPRILYLPSVAKAFYPIHRVWVLLEVFPKITFFHQTTATNFGWGVVPAVSGVPFEPGE